MADRKPAAPKRKAAPKRAAAAAVAEVAAAPAGKTLEYEGITLTLPDSLPASALMQVVELEATSESNPVALLRILRAILGPEQYTQAAYRVPQENDWESVYGLLRGCLDQFGLSLGE